MGHGAIVIIKFQINISSVLWSEALLLEDANHMTTT